MSGELIQLETGQCVGRWTIEKKLGEGAFGAVYKCTDGKGNLYALKAVSRDDVEGTGGGQGGANPAPQDGGRGASAVAEEWGPTFLSHRGQGRAPEGTGRYLRAKWITSTSSS